MRTLTTFYLLTVTQTLSLVGSRMTAIGVGIWLFTQTGATTPLLLMAFFNELPGMLAGSVAGVLVDRWDRRQAILVADIGQAAGTLLLLFSFLSGRFQTWHLFLIVLVQGVFAILQSPARDAAITMLVLENHRERANAIQQMAFPLAGVVAPVLAGTVYGFAGLGGVIAVDLATFLLAVMVIFIVRIPRPRPSDEARAAQGNVWQEMAGGLRFLRRRPPLLYLLLYGVFLNFMLNGPLELAIPYLIAITGSEAQMGALLGVSSLGAFAGALLIATWGGTRPRVHTIFPGMLLSGLMILVYGAVRHPVLLGAALFLLMLPLPANGALFISILQVKVLPDMQGRVFATMSQLSYLGSTASFLVTGPLVDHALEPAVGRPLWQWVAPLVGRQSGSGMGLLLMLTGLTILLVTALVYTRPSIRYLEATLPEYQAMAAD